MVVGPSMCGKSYFVRQMLEGDHIEYDDPRKQRHLHWFYGQYQDMFKDMRRNKRKDIYFKQGLPKFQLVLSDIDPCYNYIVVLDDLMDIAVDSPVISKLFTQGRHRNASVILLIQNAFPTSKTLVNYSNLHPMCAVYTAHTMLWRDIREKQWKTL